MRKTIITACAVALLAGCTSEPKSDNPFFSEYTTPFQVPPFEQIKHELYKPAFIKGMEEHAAEIDAIVNNLFIIYFFFYFFFNRCFCGYYFMVE